GMIHGFSAKVGTHYLVTYAMHDWLTDEHETQMLDLLRWEVLRERMGDRVEIESIFFLEKLKDAFHNQKDYTTGVQHRWVRGEGQALGTSAQEQLVLLANVRGDHWVALILDFQQDVIWYGDSLGNVISEEWCEMLDWWTHLHMGRQFDHEPLPITRQQDGFSCGLLAWNALAVFLFKDKYTLINAGNVAEERLKLLLQVISQHQENTFDANSRGYEFTF
ncbi:hypothetical protein L208DRAFT_1155032, partial [Tricholoma matsutake]